MPAVSYFAYGSNMLTERLRARVGSARPIGAAWLPGMALGFAKRGRDLSGKAMIAPGTETAHPLHGVLFEIDAGEIAVLDRFEGPGYARATLSVTAGGASRAAQVYVPRPGHLDPALRPFDWYLDLILAGARQHALPPTWIATLAATARLPDPVRDRPTRAEALRLLAGTTGATGR